MRVDTSAFRWENNTAREKGKREQLHWFAGFGEVYDITNVEPGHSIK